MAEQVNNIPSVNEWPATATGIRYICFSVTCLLTLENVMWT